MIAVDASALSAFILKEPGWKELSSYIANSISVDHIVKEVSNSIWKACVVERIIDMGQALKLYGILKSLVGTNVLIEPEERYIEGALKIALESGITVYDALYIALAKGKGLPLLTLDGGQAEVAERLKIETIHIRNQSLHSNSQIS